jgi:hypothetical protein
MTRRVKFYTRFESRVRFNGGYWDGRQAQERGWRPEWARGKHFDPAYEAGYWAGREDQRLAVVAQTSDAAWAASGLTNKPATVKGN